MITIKINKVSDEVVNVVLSDGENEYLLDQLNPEDCLHLSTSLMDAAEELLRIVAPSVDEILLDTKSNSTKMIN